MYKYLHRRAISFLYTCTKRDFGNSVTEVRVAHGSVQKKNKTNSNDKRVEERGVTLEKCVNSYTEYS